MVQFQSELSDFPKVLQKFKRNAGIYLLVFLVLGLGFTTISIFNIVHGAQSSNWPITEGKVLSFWIPSSRAINHGLRVKREYEVGNKKYISSRVSFTRNYGSMEHAYKNYPIGSRVRVHYNPNSPEQAVLEPGVTWHIFPYLFLGILFLAFWFWAHRIKKYHLQPDQRT